MFNRQVAGVIVVIVALGAAVLWAPWRVGVGAQGGEDEAPTWGRSDVAPDDVGSELLSPPDLDGAGSGPQSDGPLLSPEGVVLRDLRLAGSVLRPRASGVGYTWGRGGGCIYNTSGNAGEIWNAPLTLPEGARINTVRMYYYDESDLNATGWFSVYDLYGALVEEWSMTSSGNGGNGFADTFPVIDHTIDYSAYSYTVNWRPMHQGAGMQLCGFRIFYEPPPFGLSFLPWVAGD